LQTQKRADFELFKQIVEMVNQKHHLTIEGLQQIVNLKAALNKGLSDSLILAFPNVIVAKRLLVTGISTLDPQWVAGFTLFLFLLLKSTTNHEQKKTKN